MSTTKSAERVDAARVPSFFYSSAREGLGDLFRSAKPDSSADGGVLLPRYVGWSPREGSGLIDPVRESGRSFGFYSVEGDLSANLDSVAHQLKTGSFQFVVLVHY